MASYIVELTDSHVEELQKFKGSTWATVGVAPLRVVHGERINGGVAFKTRTAAQIFAVTSAALLSAIRSAKAGEPLVVHLVVV